MTRLEGKRVLVTGGTGGIGGAICRALLDAGARVLTCGATPERVASLPAEIQGVVCDLTEQEDIRGLAESVDLRLGGLDILINCAGIQHASTRPMVADLDATEREIRVNLLAPIQLTQQLMSRLLRGNDPTIVNITSVLALSPKQSAPTYSSTKAALSSWSTGLRFQLEDHGVRVVELVPPLVSTAMTRGRDEGAIKPKAVADCLIDGLHRNKDTILVGQARLAALLHRLAPGLLARKLRKG